MGVRLRALRDARRAPAFQRQHATDIIAAVIEREPDWTRLPEETPPGIRRLLRRCLNKDVKQRLRDFGDIRLELADKQDDEAAGPTSRRTDRRAIGVWVSASLATVALVAVAAMWLFSRAVTSSSVIRATITMPRELELDTSPGAAPIALSADGQQLAFVAFTKGRGLLYVRDIGAFEARPLPGTEGARYPFFSPDGQWIGFFADAKLKRISLSGGAAVPICDASGTGRGGTWGSDGTIIFDPGASGLMRVAAMGGAPHRVTSRDTVMDAQNLSWPHFLPEARSVLVTVGPEVIAEGMPSLAVLSLESGDWHPIGPGSQAQYVESGHILYHAVHAREGQVDAVAFDAKRFAVRGSSITVVDGVFRARNGGAAYFAAAGMKTLVFAPGGLSHTLGARRPPWAVYTALRRSSRISLSTGLARWQPDRRDHRSETITSLDLRRRAPFEYPAGD